MTEYHAGRHFLQIPGPTNVPDRVLRAIDNATIDHRGPAFGRMGMGVLTNLRAIFQTAGPVVIYPASGTGAWEAALTNTLSPGDTVLMCRTGWFATLWNEMATRLDLKPILIDTDWRRGADVAAIGAALADDKAHRIKAVCVVHNETATGMMLPLDEIRAAIDAAKHPALFLVDTISSLGSLDFRMDEWKIDCVVGGSQKGLMLPTGVSFTGVSAKGMEAHARAKLPRFYFDWTLMEKRQQKSFIGTVPVNMFYGLRESIRLLEDEGLPNVYARHTRLAEATRRAVQVWAGNNGPQLYCTNPSRYSDSVTAVQMPDGHDAEAVRNTARHRFNVSLGGGLGKLKGTVFRIGHLGDLNEPMVLGALAAVEMALRMNNIPHGRGGVDAAMDYLAQA